MSAIVQPKRALLVYPGKDYVPREQWSPSGLGTGEACEMMWFLRYVLGIKEADLVSWEEAQHLPKPVKPNATLAAVTALQEAQHRDAVKEYNRLTRRALGHAVHDVLARHFDWHPPLQLIDWHDRAGRTATMALNFLPAPEECGSVEVEAELEMFWGPEADPLRIWGYADLILTLGLPLEFELNPGVLGVLMPGSWLLTDYKSTYNFDNIPLAKELVADVAANFYALAVMVRENLDVLHCRWIYVRTDETKPDDAQKVDFTISRAGALEVLAPYEGLALRLRDKMRLAKQSPLHAAKLSMHNPLACDRYGRPGFPNCVYHHVNGGKCKPPRVSASASIKANIERDAMLAARREAQRGKPRPAVVRSKARAVDAPPKRVAASLSASHNQSAESESTGITMGRFSKAREDQKAGAGATAPAASEGATETAPATRAPRAPKAPKAAGASDMPVMSLVVAGGPSIPLPEGSAIHTLGLKLVDALYPADA